MEQALTDAGQQERAGDRRRRPDPGVGAARWRKRFPKVKFSIIGGNARPRSPTNVARLRRASQAEIAFVAGAAAAMLSKTGAVSYVGGLEIPADRQRRQRVRQRRQVRSTRRSSTSRTTPATSTTSPSPRRRRWPPSPRAPTSTTTSSTSACAAWSRRPARRARTSSAATPTAAAPTRSTSPTAITGVGYQVRVRHRAGGRPAPGSRSSSRSAWRWARRPPTW